MKGRLEGASSFHFVYNQEKINGRICCVIEEFPRQPDFISAGRTGPGASVEPACAALASFCRKIIFV